MASSPISAAQLAANRENAKHSTGPACAEAKSRTRLNGLRHGLTGQTVFLPDEDRVAYDRHHAELLKSLKPEGPCETQLTRQIADAYWRLNRISAIEHNIFAFGIEAHTGEFRDEPDGNAALSQAQTFLEQSRQLNLLSLYEQRINRSVLSLHRELARLRADRLADEARRAEARSNARAARHYESLLRSGHVYGNGYGQLYDDVQSPDPVHGFGFSNPQTTTNPAPPGAPEPPLQTQNLVKKAA